MSTIEPADALCWFGATGDLGFKMTFPSLYAVAKRGNLTFPIIAVSRSGWTLDDLKERAHESIEKHGGIDDATAFDHLVDSLHYVDGDYTDLFTFAHLRNALDSVGSSAPCHYLAIPPTLFPTVVASLGASGCADNTRVIVEKPFGRDLTSAGELDRALHAVFPEERVFRIDHYLGKEEVQNLSYIRFANSVFEPIWGRDHIKSVQITLAENFGVEGRGNFYEETGALRDVVQNHLFQIVSLLAMSPPAGHHVDAFREEKERVLRAIDTLTRDDLVRGQYVGYRDEPGVAPDSDVETFAAVRLHIDSWRWAGVPWYLRAGKCMPCHTTEVLVEFRTPPQRVYRNEAVDLAAEPNFIRFRLSPAPIVGLGVRTLIASDGIRSRRNELMLSDDVHDERLPYERLLADAMAGERFLFTSQAGMEAAWRVVERVLTHHDPAIPYQPGTWGPAEANRLIEDGLGLAYAEHRLAMTIDVAEATPATTSSDRARLLRWGLVGVLVLPVAVAIVGAFSLHAHPAMDWALIELRVRDVGTSQTPLLGPFSRFGWNHPGPLLFWGLAIPYRLLGATSDAMFVGAGLVNLLSVIGIGWQAHRRGGLTLLAWTALLGALFLHGQGALFLVDPWNPSVVVLPFALLGFLTWSIAEGEFRLTPLWVLVASWIVQSHIGFAPLVGAFGLWALGWLVARHRERPTWRWVGIAVVLGFVLWLPPLVEQATGNPGNAEQIARHYFGDRANRDVPDPQWNELTGVDKAVQVYNRHLALNGVWLGGDESTDLFTGELLGSHGWGALPALLVFAGASALVVWRRRGDAARLAAQTGLGLAVGFVAATRIDGYAFPYLFGWLEVLGLFLWLSVGWSLYRSLPQRPARAVRQVAIPVASVMAGLVSLLTALEVVTDLEPPLPKADETVAAVAPPTVDATRGKRVLIINAGSCLNDVGYGVANQLERNGIDVVVSADQENRFGEDRIWDGDNADVQATIACKEAVDGALAEADADPEVDVVATWDPVPPELAATEDQIRAAVADALRDLGRDDLLPDVDTGWIVFSGPGAGLTEEVLGPYRQLMETRGERVVVLLGPPRG